MPSQPSWAWLYFVSRLENFFSTKVQSGLQACNKVQQWCTLRSTLNTGIPLGVLITIFICSCFNHANEFLITPAESHPWKDWWSSCSWFLANVPEQTYLWMGAAPTLPPKIVWHFEMPVPVMAIARNILYSFSYLHQFQYAVVNLNC